MAKKPAPVSTANIDVTKLSSPRIFLVRMLVFLILCGLVFVVLYKQVLAAFLANPAFWGRSIASDNLNDLVLDHFISLTEKPLDWERIQLLSGD